MQAADVIRLIRLVHTYTSEAIKVQETDNIKTDVVEVDGGREKIEGYGEDGEKRPKAGRGERNSTLRCVP